MRLPVTAFLVLFFSASVATGSNTIRGAGGGSGGSSRIRGAISASTDSERDGPQYHRRQRSRKSTTATTTGLRSTKDKGAHKDDGKKAVVDTGGESSSGGAAEKPAKKSETKDDEVSDAEDKKPKDDKESKEEDKEGKEDEEADEDASSDGSGEGDGEDEDEDELPNAAAAKDASDGGRKRKRRPEQLRVVKKRGNKKAEKPKRGHAQKYFDEGGKPKKSPGNPPPAEPTDGSAEAESSSSTTNNNNEEREEVEEDEGPNGAENIDPGFELAEAAIIVAPPVPAPTSFPTWTFKVEPQQQQIAAEAAVVVPPACRYCGGGCFDDERTVQFRRGSAATCGHVRKVAAMLRASQCNIERKVIEDACCCGDDDDDDEKEEPSGRLEEIRQRLIGRTDPACSFCEGMDYSETPIISFSSGNDSVSCGGLMDIAPGLSASFCNTERAHIEEACCRPIRAAAPTPPPVATPAEAVPIAAPTPPPAQVTTPAEAVPIEEKEEVEEEEEDDELSGNVTDTSVTTGATTVEEEEESSFVAGTTTTVDNPSVTGPAAASEDSDDPPGPGRPGNFPGPGRPPPRPGRPGRPSTIAEGGTREKGPLGSVSRERQPVVDPASASASVASDRAPASSRLDSTPREPLYDPNQSRAGDRVVDSPPVTPRRDFGFNQKEREVKHLHQVSRNFDRSIAFSGRSETVHHLETASRHDRIFAGIHRGHAARTNEN